VKEKLFVKPVFDVKRDGNGHNNAWKIIYNFKMSRCVGSQSSKQKFSKKPGSLNLPFSQHWCSCGFLDHRLILNRLLFN
jgi:hypothetical protein